MSDRNGTAIQKSTCGRQVVFGPEKLKTATTLPSSDWRQRCPCFARPRGRGRTGRRKIPNLDKERMRGEKGSPVTHSKSKVCSKCGDTGFSELLIYCRKCKYFAEHRYCSTETPAPRHQLQVSWTCEDCRGSDSPYRAPSVAGPKSCSDSTPTSSHPQYISGWSSTEGINGGKEIRNPKRKLVLTDESSSYTDGKSYRGQSGVMTNCNGYISSKSDSVWRGCIRIGPQRSIGAAGHISDNACSRVWEAAKELPTKIYFEMLPKTRAWPQAFSISPPTDEDVGLFFFPGAQGYLPKASHHLS